MLVYLDTNIWIYAYEDDPRFGGSARRFIERLRSGGHRIASSLFVLNELLVQPTRRGDSFVVASYRTMFSSPVLQVLPYTMNAAQTYARLRAFDRLKALDALHLATAAEAQVDLFITEDSQLLSRTVPGIRAIEDLSAVLS